jgi:hypothetical protein
MISLKRSFIGLLALLVVSAACAGPAPTQPGWQQSTPMVDPAPAETHPTFVSPTETPEVLPHPADTPPAAAPAVEAFPTPGAGSEASIPVYRLEARLDYANRRAAVQEEIEYTNRSGEALADILLLVETNRFPDAFILEEIQLDGQGRLAAFTLEQDRLLLALEEPLEPNEKISISIHYELNLPAIPAPSGMEKPQPFGYSRDQLNLVDWYPYIPPYQPGKGWIANQPWFFGEHQVYETADFRVDLELAGEQVELQVAASAPAEQNGSIYRYSHPKARNFALSLSHRYAVLETEVEGAQVRVFVYPEDVLAGEAALQNAADALQLYSRLYAPFPRQSLSVVAGDFLDGMEYDGLFFLNRSFFRYYAGTPQGYLTIITVHETAHQWWYALVGNDQANEPWLDEALCTFSELIFYENYYPGLVDWWWSFRVHLYQPQGWINLPVYEYAGMRPYRDAVYLNGAVFFDELRAAMGEEFFFSFIQAYARGKSYQISNSRSFFALLKEHTPVDLENLLNRYIK